MSTKAKHIEARNLKGFHDKLPAEAMLKGKMLHTLRGVFESYGFTPIETPHLEYAEILVNDSEDDAQKQLYRFKDHGDRDVALRFDLTVPFARFVVQHRHELNLPFKRYAIGNVFRGESPQAGRYREFTQCDFDFVGTTSVGADAEIVQIISSSLEALGIKDYLIRLNNRKVLNAYLKFLGIEGKTGEVLRIVDKLDKIGEAKVKEQLVAGLSFTDAAVSELLTFVSLKQEGPSEQFFASIAHFKEKSPELAAALAELEDLFGILAKTNIPQENYQIDFSIARGLGYYTGTVYETTHKGAPELGSICSGGRYDDLTMTFSNEQMPGVGASFGIDRLLAVLEKLNLVQKSQTPAQLLIGQMSAELRGDVYRVSEQLRQKGLRVEVYPDLAKLKKQFSYADAKGHPFVLVLGSEEIAKGMYAVKDMKTGAQIECADIDEVAALVKKGPQ